MAALSKDLLELIADPETHAPLAQASDAELGQLKKAIAAGKAKRRDGKAPSTSFEAALVTPSRKAVYLVEGGIANLLVDERLELTEAL